MIKADLVAQIAARTGQHKEHVAATVEALFEVVKTTLIEDKNPIVLRGFGTFHRKHHPKRHARNIQTNTAIVVEAYDSPAFKPSPEFKDQVKKGGG